MGWLFLSLAIVSEVIGTTFLKRADGNVLSYSGLLMMVFYAISFTFLTIAIKCNIELGVGYAIWSGVGTVLIVLIGIYAFGENSSVIKFLCIGLIIMGVVGLKLDTPSHRPEGEIAAPPAEPPGDEKQEQ
ncbi:MAG: multidrug efflux SMR transporter [Mariniblastus sp.]|nr:multidrug efflux SMR transporter [Mariniblastus sp.]